jgi:hypothetical protein
MNDKEIDRKNRGGWALMDLNDESLLWWFKNPAIYATKRQATEEIEKLTKMNVKIVKCEILLYE